MANFKIGVDFAGDLGNLPNHAKQAADAIKSVGGAASTTSSALNGLGGASAAASNAFNTISKSAVASGQALNKLSPAIKPILTDLKAIPPAASAAAAGISKVKGAGGQASATLTDFSRIVQDAPFGFVAIGNNITQLVDSFGNLKRSAGGTGAAFKQLFSAAGGFGGIGLAISAITTAITLASVGFDAWTRGFKKMSGGVDEFNEALKDANKEAASEIAKLTLLNSITADTSRTTKERETAIKQLQKEYPEYFGNLSREAFLMGDVAKETLAAATAIKSKAKAQAILTLVAKETEKQLEIEVRRAELQRKFEDRAAKFAKQSEDLNKNLQITPRAARITDNAFKDIADSLDDANKEFATSEQRVADLVRQFDQADLKNPFDFKEPKAKKPGEDEVLKALRKELAGYERQLRDIDELRKQGALPINQENDALQLQLKIFDTLSKIDAREVVIKAKPDLEINPKIMDLQIDQAIKEAGIRASAGDPKTIPINARVKFSDGSTPAIFSPADILGPIPEGAFDKIVEQAVKASKIAQEKLREELRQGFLDTTAKSIQEGIIGAADVLGSSLATIFQEGVGEGLAQAAQGFLGIIGNVLQEVGKQVVVASKLIIVLKKALSKLFGEPVAGLATGLSLIALGALLKNIKIPAFADGVTNFGGGLALVGERGPELVNLPNGSDVIPNNQIGRYSGGDNLVASGILRGSDILLSVQRESNRRRRI